LKGFQIEAGIPLKKSVRNILSAISEQLRMELTQPAGPHETIHLTRKTIKRIRALLKMVREETGYSFYYRENLYFRDLARKMTPARDQKVLLDTFNQVVARHPRLLREKDQQTIRMQLNSELEERLQTLGEQEGGLKNILNDLIAAISRLSDSLDLQDGFEVVRGGIQRIYRRGRKYLPLISVKPEMVMLHEYRKNCRYLQFQMELLQPLYPVVLHSYAESIDDHTEVLGRYRDHARLESYLDTPILPDLGKESIHTLQNRISHRRVKAFQKIVLKGQLIYAEKPAVFIRRIRHYWNANQFSSYSH